MILVELNNIVCVLDGIGCNRNFISKMCMYFGVIKDVIWNYIFVVNEIFVYEINGYGGLYIMDDVNVFSLVFLLYFNFLERDNEIYQKIKKVFFLCVNFYYVVGKNFIGIGQVEVFVLRRIC